MTSLRALHTDGDAAVLLDAISDALVAFSDLPAVIAGLADEILTDFNDVKPERQVIGAAARVHRGELADVADTKGRARRRCARAMRRQV